MLAAITVMQIFFDVKKLSKNLFYNIKTREGRGNISKLELDDKKIFLIDESYNSNPLSLKSALQNFDKIEINKKKKHILLGDMRELGKHSKKLHKSMAQTINMIEINKAHIIGNNIKETYKKINKTKKGIILKMIRN